MAKLFILQYIYTFINSRCFPLGTYVKIIHFVLKVALLLHLTEGLALDLYKRVIFYQFLLLRSILRHFLDGHPLIEFSLRTLQYVISRQTKVISNHRAILKPEMSEVHKGPFNKFNDSLKGN